MYCTSLHLFALATWLADVTALPTLDRANVPIEPKIVKSTVNEDGLTIDWILLASQGHVASPPPDTERRRSLGHSNPPALEFLLDRSTHDNDDGPNGTVPIIRASVDPLGKPIKQLPSKQDIEVSCADTKSTGTQPTSSSGKHWYASTAQTVNNHGGKAAFSLYKAFTQSNSDFSLLQTAVIKTNAVKAGSPETTTQTVEAGWINYPNQIKAPHLFTYFTTVGYTSEGDNIGCWNRGCGGWVQVDKQIYPGVAFARLSQEDGAQYELEIGYTLFEGNWWLWVLDRYIGYYPGSLFAKGVDKSKTLGGGSNQINFYGEVFNSETGVTTTDMGSGHLPSAGFGKSAYLHNIYYIDSKTGSYINYDGSKGLIVSDAARYQIAPSYNSGTSWGSFFYLGGPGAGGKIGA